MGFIRTLRGKVNVGTGGENSERSNSQARSAGCARDKGSSADETLPHRGLGGSRAEPAAPSSARPAPPFHAQDAYAPPPSPPPANTRPTTRQSPRLDPPPPSENPPPYHDWTIIPDTALLPPPPAFPQQYSSANNASYESADAAHEWCDRNGVYSPSMPNQRLRDAVARGQVDLLRPPASAKNVELKQAAPGTWWCRAKPRQPDMVLLSNLPLYFAAVDCPLRSGVEKVVYYELRVLAIKDAESGIAIGFAAKPYPPWRLPGWHRASLAVHGDDGRRFVNDPWGGRDFVGAFQVGDVVGLGIRYLPQELGNGAVKTKVFFTRNGAEEGGWDMDEERDAEMDRGIDGLQGELDEYPAVGVFGGVELEVRFRKDEWMYQPA
ncbi:hypothetical protein DV737_g3574, partial [Chaetothyriales sp. CBS 132003]